MAFIPAIIESLGELVPSIEALAPEVGSALKSFTGRAVTALGTWTAVKKLGSLALQAGHWTEAEFNKFKKYWSGTTLTAAHKANVVNYLKSRMARNGKKSKNGGGNGNNGGGGGGNGNRVTNRMTPSVGLMNVNSNYREMNNRTPVLKGSDLVTTVVAKPSTSIVNPSDSILVNFTASPTSYPGTRLFQLSQLWERYRFISLRYRFVPAVPNTLACQFVMYVDTDPNDDPSAITDRDALIRQALAHTGAQQWNFNLPKNVMLPIRADNQLYYTGITSANERFSAMGRVFLLQITDPVNFNGALLTEPVIAGSLFVDWHIMFQTPQIAVEATSAQVALIQNPGLRLARTLLTYDVLTTITNISGQVVDFYLCADTGNYESLAGLSTVQVTDSGIGTYGVLQDGDTGTITLGPQLIILNPGEVYTITPSLLNFGAVSGSVAVVYPAGSLTVV